MPAIMPATCSQASQSVRIFPPENTSCEDSNRVLQRKECTYHASRPLRKPSHRFHRPKPYCLLLRSFDDTTRFSVLMTSLRFGSAAYLAGDTDRAKRVFAEAAQLFARLGNERGRAIAVTNLGSGMRAQAKNFVSLERAQSSVSNGGNIWHSGREGAGFLTIEFPSAYKKTTFSSRDSEILFTKQMWKIVLLNPALFFLLFIQPPHRMAWRLSRSANAAECTRRRRKALQ
jgi:hypothetical protein